MRKIENDCVGCPEGMGCLGSSCPYVNVLRYYCDECGSDNAEYTIDGTDLCESCAENYLLDLFNEMTINEKAEALGVDICKVEDSSHNDDFDYDDDD